MMQIMRKVVDKGERPPVPEGMPSDPRKLMLRAWSQDPAKRPTFADICKQLRITPPRAASTTGPPAPAPAPGTDYFDARRGESTAYHTATGRPQWIGSGIFDVNRFRRGGPSLAPEETRRRRVTLKRRRPKRRRPATRPRRRPPRRPQPHQRRRPPPRLRRSRSRAPSASAPDGEPRRRAPTPRRPRRHPRPVRRKRRHPRPRRRRQRPRPRPRRRREAGSFPGGRRRIFPIAAST